MAAKTKTEGVPPLIAAMRKLTPKQRLDVFGNFCCHCGDREGAAAVPAAQALGLVECRAEASREPDGNATQRKGESQ